MQIINVHQLLNNYTLRTNLSDDDNMVFIESSDFINNPDKPIQYIRVHKVNYKTQTVDKFELNHPADLITLVSSNDIVYYATIDKQDSCFSISLNKVNCLKWNEENILSIPIHVDENSDCILSSSLLVGLNKRYALLAIPKTTPIYGQPFFDKILLIDTFEKNTYLIPDKIGEYDTLLRLDEIYVDNKGKHVTFKTGRIRPFEKKQIWDEQSKTGNFEEYYDHIETVLSCGIHEFANNVKSGIGLDNGNIVEKCDLHGALSIIGNDSSKLVLSINKFNATTIEVKTFYFELNKLDISKSIGKYESLIYFNSKLYGLLKHGIHIDIYDIFDGTKIYRSDENIIYIDNDYIMSLKPTGVILENRFTARQLSDGLVINTFNCRFSEYDFERNVVIVY